MVARANGVGPKLAERIVRELKDKVGGIAASLGSADGRRLRSARRRMRCRRCSTSAFVRPKRRARWRRRKRSLGRAQRSIHWSGSPWRKASRS